MVLALGPEDSRGLALTVEVVVDSTGKTGKAPPVTSIESGQDTGEARVVPADVAGEVVPLTIANVRPAVVGIGLEIVEPLLHSQVAAREEGLRVRW